MQKAVLLVVGLALLGYGGYRQVWGSEVSAADRSRCEQQARDQTSRAKKARWILSCDDPGLVAMMEAEASGDTAQAAAARISAANQAVLRAEMWNWSLLAIGTLALAGAALVRRPHA